MTPQPFKVGDRVRCFDVCGVSGKLTDDTGIIEGIKNDGGLIIRFDTWNNLKPHPVHPKWCRLIKPPKERRRVFVVLHDNPSRVQYVAKNSEDAEKDADFYKRSGYSAEVVEFIEVPRKTGKDGG